MVFSHHLQNALACDAGDGMHDHCAMLLGRMRGHHRASSFAEGAEPDQVDAEKDSAGTGSQDKRELSEFYKAQSPDVQAYVTKVQDNILQMQSKWTDGLVRYDDSYQQMKTSNTARMEDWEVLKTRLQRKCESLRDAVDRLSEAKAMCARMQGEELPALFKIKAKDPDRVARFGDIQGCVRQDIETGEFVPEKCECVMGTEKAGCLDSIGNTANTLSCSHILNYRMPNMPLAEFFKEGGACEINSKEAWNDPIVHPNDFKNKSGSIDDDGVGGIATTQSSVGPVATNTLSVMPQCISLLRRSSRGKPTSREELRAFL